MVVLQPCKRHPHRAYFDEVTRNVVQEVVNRNESLPATEAVKITTMAGCSAVKNNIRFKTLDS
jgi:ATP-binding protein involved in chromosome partitioning